MVAPANSPANAEPGISGTPGSGASVAAGNEASASPSTGESQPAPGPAVKDLGQVSPSRRALDVATVALVPRSLSHAFHNMAAVLLSLPDVVTLDTLDGLSNKGPWGSQTWTGELTPAQNIATVGNLALLAFGLACSWRRFRLAGLVPALVFLGYDLSLAAAATSGGRYIVPINWVAHFYYAVGLIDIIGAVAHVQTASATEKSLAGASDQACEGLRYPDVGSGSVCCDGDPFCQRCSSKTRQTPH